MDKKRILIVDDEAPVTKLLKMHLDGTGSFEVHTENDPLQAVNAARDFQPEIIVLDYMMPRLDGGEIAAQLKEDEGLSHVPVVFLTGIVSQNDAGMTGTFVDNRAYLAKPIDPTDLEGFLRNFFAVSP